VRTTALLLSCHTCGTANKGEQTECDETAHTHSLHSHLRCSSDQVCLPFLPCPHHMKAPARCGASENRTKFPVEISLVSCPVFARPSSPGLECTPATSKSFCSLAAAGHFTSAFRLDCSTRTVRSCTAVPVLTTALDHWQLDFTHPVGRAGAAAPNRQAFRRNLQIRAC
jgi:hypothetical protein